MAENITVSRPAGNWVAAVIAAWLIPGGGHFMLKRTGRGAIIFGVVVLTFLFGIMMEGTLFEPQGGDLLTTVIYYGGFVANLLSGLPYIFAKWFGYAQPDVAGHVHDYGTKFLAAAGLFNLLGIMDAFEIATGKKD